MSLLRTPPICPLHGEPLILSHHGKKTNLGHYFIEVVGAPLRYCPACHAQGRDTSVEIEPGASTAFLKRLAHLLDTSDFPGLLQRPRVRVDFNPSRTSLDHPYRQGLTGQVGGAPHEPPGQHLTREQGEQPAARPGEGSVAIRGGAGAQPVTAHASVPPEREEPRLEGIEPLEPRHSLDQLILDQDTLERIREATNVLVSQDLIYDTWNLSAVARTGRRVALNFYGPPGTGKTLAADAIAHLLGKRILRISYAELESKYVGETPKNIQAAFAKAAETGALLFFDEADSILGKRLVNVSQSADNSINVARSTTLIELDNFNGAVIFASNLVRNYDTAFLRRMLAHVEFRLPGAAQREQIWRLHIPPQLPLAEDVDLHRLAASCEGAAGGDIQNAVLLAASYASMRSGPERLVMLHDLERAIAFILEGKRKILEGSSLLHETLQDPG